MYLNTQKYGLFCSLAMFSIRWNGKYFNEWNFYLDILRIQENWVGWKFHNELACVFTAHYASKNADWNQQQLTDGGVLANRNSANHPYCFLSNQKKVQILAFLHVICERNVSYALLPNTDYRDKGTGNDRRLNAALPSASKSAKSPTHQRLFKNIPFRQTVYSNENILQNTTPVSKVLERCLRRFLSSFQ